MSRHVNNTAQHETASHNTTRQRCVVRRRATELCRGHNPFWFEHIIDSRFDFKYIIENKLLIINKFSLSGFLSNLLVPFASLGLRRMKEAVFRSTQPPSRDIKKIENSLFGNLP